MVRFVGIVLAHARQLGNRVVPFSRIGPGRGVQRLHAYKETK